MRYGAWYLEHLRDKYQARPNSTDLALAAYNAGQGQVDQWLAETPPGSPVRIGFAETRAYVARVHQLQSIYRRAYASQLGYAQASGGWRRASDQRRLARPRGRCYVVQVGVNDGGRR